MNGVWHSIRNMFTVALAAVLLVMCSLETVCPCEHGDSDSQTQDAAMCACGCPHMIGLLPPSEPHVAPITESPTFNYAPLYGTPVPAEIFRPPLG